MRIDVLERYIFCDGDGCHNMTKYEVGEKRPDDWGEFYDLNLAEPVHFDFCPRCTSAAEKTNSYIRVKYK